MDYRALDELPSNEGEPEPVFAGSSPKQPRKRRRWTIAIILIALVVIAVVAAAAYELVWHKRPSPAQTTSQQSTRQTSLQPQPTTVGDTGTTQYTSNGKDLDLGFTYPSSWSVVPPSGNNPNDQAITVSSPLVSLAGASGQATTSKIVIAIRPGGTTASELASDKAVVSQASVQIAYAKPTASQHQYPFLTFVNLEGGQNPAGFDEVIITGVTSFAKGQSILPESVTQIDPLITARLYTCSTSSCDTSASSSLAITNATWQDDATCKQVQDLFASLQLN